MIESNASISVIIPTYNAGTYIDDALQSIWDQTIRPCEIIVVDDASTDGTADRVASMIYRSNTPLKLIRRVVNSGGPAKPINEGVQSAKGSLICVLDQDDTWLPTKLKLESRVLQQRPDVAFVFSHATFTSENLISRIRRSFIALRLRQVLKNDGDCLRCSGDVAFKLLIRFENYVVGFPGFMFRRRDWQQRRIDESFTVAADYDFLCWLCSRGDVVYIPQTHFLRREHDGNITHSEVPRLIDVVRILTRYISPVQMKSRGYCRRALASKVLRLAQFLTLCGHVSQGRRMLRAYYEIRGQSLDTLQKPLRLAQFANLSWIKRILALHNSRQVTADQADEAVGAVDELIADYLAINHPESITFKIGSLSSRKKAA